MRLVRAGSPGKAVSVGLFMVAGGPDLSDQPAGELQGKCEMSLPEWGQFKVDYQAKCEMTQGHSDVSE